jgi:transaldolase
LVKLAATWEGIKAAEKLEKEGIHCNLTLVFTLAQAIACADSGITLISPFVGRINDGYSTKYGKTYPPNEEPGVLLVKEIFNYYRKFDHKTIIMAASLRTAESTLELSGVDRITMPPNIIEKLRTLNQHVELKLNSEVSTQMEIKRIEMNEKTFRWMVNEDEIGNEKLADGIRIFARDAIKLEKIIRDRLHQK